MRVALVVVALCALVAGAAAARPFGIYPSMPSGTQYVGVDVVYMNATFKISKSDAAAYNDTTADSVAAHLVAEFINPYFDGETDCAADSVLPSGSLDLSDLAYGIVSTTYMPGNGTSQEEAFAVVIKMQSKTGGSFDVGGVTDRIADCAPLNAIAGPAPGTAYFTLRANFAIDEMMPRFSLLGAERGGTKARLPEARGVYALFIEYPDAAGAAEFVDAMEDPFSFPMIAFRECLNREFHAIVGERGASVQGIVGERGFHVNDTWVHFAAQNPEAMQYVAARWIVDLPRAPRPDFSVEDDEDESLAEAILGDAVRDKCFGALLHAADTLGEPTLPQPAEFMFNATVYDYLKIRFGASDNGGTALMAVEMSEDDFMNKYMLPSGGSVSFWIKTPDVMKPMLVDPMDQFGMDIFNLVSASYNGSHALLHMSVHLTEEQDEMLKDDEDSEDSAGDMLTEGLMAAFPEATSAAVLVGGGGGDGDFPDPWALGQLELSFTVAEGPIDPQTAQGAAAAIFFAAQDLTKGDTANGCGAMCMDAVETNAAGEFKFIDFNVDGKVNSTRHNFTIMWLDHAVTSVGGKMYIRIAAMGNEEEVKAFAERVKSYSSFLASVSSSICAGYPTCTLTYSVDTADLMGNAIGGGPGNFQRQGAHVAFRVFGLPAVAFDAPDMRLSMAVRLRAALVADGVSKPVVNMLGCIDEPQMAMRSSVVCMVDIKADTDGSAAALQNVADKAKAAVFGGQMFVPNGPANDFTLDDVAVFAAADVTASTWKMSYATNIDPKFIDTAAWNSALSAAAISVTGTTEAASYTWDGCVGVAPAVCFVSFTPEPTEASNPDDVVTRVNSIVAATLNTMGPTVPASVGAPVMDDVDPCWRCVASARFNDPIDDPAASNGANVGEFQVAFRGPGGDMFAMRAEGGNQYVAYSYATSLAMSRTPKLGFLDGPGNALPMGAFMLEEGWKNDDFGGSENSFQLKFKFVWTNGDAGSRQRLLKEARRRVNIEAAEYITDITSMEFRPACEINFFKYEQTSAGTTTTHIATDECMTFYTSAQCGAWTTINDRMDGSGKTYWLLPSDAYAWDDSGLVQCNCDMSGGCNSPVQNNNGGPGPQ